MYKYFKLDLKPAYLWVLNLKKVTSNVNKQE